MQTTTTIDTFKRDVVLETRECGKYTVKVIVNLYGNICYDVYDGRTRVPCMTKAEERRYPKRPARLGTEMVREWQRRADSVGYDYNPPLGRLQKPVAPAVKPRLRYNHGTGQLEPVAA